MPLTHDYARLFLRGLLIVALQAANTLVITGHRLPQAFAVSMLLSLLWWGNAKKSGRSDDVPYAGIVYGLGAGCGALVGMLLIGWFYGGR